MYLLTLCTKFVRNSTTAPNIRFLSISRSHRERTLCLGLGSNVVDYIYSVESLPKEGMKGYFTRGISIPQAKKAGGVVLNHLAWSAHLGVPCGLLALQGNDEEGKFLRDFLKKANVQTDFIHVSDQYNTGFSHIMVEPSGELKALDNFRASKSLFFR